MKKLILAALASAAAFSAVPAAAGPVITSIQIKTVNTVPGQGALQIAELQLFAGSTNVALAPSGTASATSVYTPGGSVSVASFANDGSTNGAYPSIYHGDAYDGSDVFTLTLANPTAIDRVSIYGRTDACCGFRDLYSFELFNGSTSVLSGRLDARQNAFASTAVPEPATWAMMLLGLGLVGAGLRSRRHGSVATRVAFA